MNENKLLLNQLDDML